MSIPVGGVAAVKTERQSGLAHQGAPAPDCCTTHWCSGQLQPDTFI